MTKYELMFIVRPDLPEEELDKLAAQMEAVVTGAGGRIEKIEKMGRRRLAYRVERQREGFYVLFIFEGTGDTVHEFERRLKVSDPVIKFLTVRMDEQMKRAEKFKVQSARREARKPRPKPAPEASAGSAAAEAPAQE
jgi:small subunit ribosomal protein S6